MASYGIIFPLLFSIYIFPAGILHIISHALYTTPTNRTVPSNGVTIKEAEGYPEVSIEAAGDWVGCTDCSSRKATLSPEDLRQARIELLKYQILQKLRLKEPPHVKVHKSSISSILMSTGFFSDDPDGTFEQHNVSEDFYGKTKRVIVFPENNTYSCFSTRSPPSECLLFHFPNDLAAESIASADLWVHTDGGATAANQSFVVSELISNASYKKLKKRMLDYEETFNASGWVQFQIGSSLSKWISRRRLRQTLEVSCISCESHEKSPLSLDEDKKPFIVIHVDSFQVSSRNKRSVDCTEDDSRCCRDSFYLSFAEIGWDQWIFHPTGYMANFCRGSCIGDVSISKYHHSSVVQKYLESHKEDAERMNLSLCCTPSKMSAISLIYTDDEGNFFQKILPNMVVEACECA